MKSLFRFSFPKTFLLLFALGTTVAVSQQYYTIAGGAGTTRTWGQYVYPNPLQDYWYTIRSQFLIRASELQFYTMPGGIIESMAFNIRTSTPFASRALTIEMKQTTLTALVNPQDRAGFTTVYTTPSMQLPVLNNTPTWLNFQFQTPFQWDGVSNIMIHVCWYRPGYTYVFPDYEYTNVSPVYATQNYYYNDINNGCAATVSGGLYSVRPVLRFGVLAGIEASFPDDVDPRRILRAGSVYDGSPGFPKPSLSFRQSVGQNISLTYKIIGPLPSTNVIYQGLKAGVTPIAHTGTSNGLFTYTMDDASGIAAGAGGTLNLTNVAGGAYRLEATYTIPGYTQLYQKEFSIAFPDDVALRSIRSPLEVPRKYPRGVTIPISANIQNVGLNDVKSARVTAVLRRAADNSEVYREITTFNGTLKTGEVQTVDFPSFTSLEVRSWTASFCVELLNAIDNQAANDCTPRVGAPSYVFQTLYNEEVGAQAIENPTTTGEYYALRPFRPRGRIINGGIQDLSDIPVRMKITNLATGAQVYNQLIIVPDVGAEPPLNISSFEFPTFTPPSAGQYQACLTTEYLGDQVASNDQVCVAFTVNPNLSGVYTIGTLKAGNARNYLTIQDAVNDLYKQGVSAAVDFELTDAEYSLGSTALNQPALDLTSKIIGVGPNSPISFVPSLDKSLTKGSVVITLNSGTGVGILMGQSILTSNVNAVQFTFQKEPQWATSDGYFRFNGGLQRSLSFVLNATTPFRALFYLGDGTHDISIKNCLIGNASTAAPSYNTSLPIVSFVSNTLTFQADVRVVGVTTNTYSAGIVSRQKLPSGRDGNNSERLDTVRGDRNEFVNNDISGFGYGIVTMGIGAAIKGGINTFQPYYNTRGLIQDNTIYNVRRAGVFVGYEDGIKITHNRIYNVGVLATSGTNVDAAGILIGGETRYHNINTVIDRNEVSGISGDLWARGIRVDQARNIFPSIGGGGNVTFPQVEENTAVRSNIVWGLRRTGTGAGMAGIHLLTARNTVLTGTTQFITQALNTDGYFTRKDVVYNNTVLMEDDNVLGTNAVTGIGIQHGNGTTLKNNVVMMRGTSSASSFSHAALTVQGIQMNDGNDPMALVSDRNVYQVGSASFARFIEITPLSEVVSLGTTSEFTNLAQWRAWTRRDLNSVVGNVFTEHEVLGIAPNQRLRVKSNPTPISSIMNNRGERLASVTTDVDGDLRGANGQRYDIGADEFSGREYNLDLEAMDISKPSTYRSSTGVTSDAMYYMTKSPVDITALIRNNGSLGSSNASIRLRIYLETAASNNAELVTPQWSGTPVVDRVVTTALASGESKDIVFTGQNWTPTTYLGLATYTVPTRFSTMGFNVTPRYRVEVSTGSDENNANNTFTKDVRFYLQKSGIRAIVSARGSSTNISSGVPTTNDIAGRLNGDSLMTYMRHIGWINDPLIGQYAYDVFERNAWEERAVDYRMWRTVFWSHDQSAFTRYERNDIRAFVATGSPAEKKNLVLASQDAARLHVGLNVINDQAFVNKVLRVSNVAPGTPVPPPINTYHDKRIKGVTIARDAIETVTRTGFTGDSDPIPALVRIYSDATTSGIANPTYIYMKGDRTTFDSISGAAVQGLNSTLVYLGVDWRHYKRTGAQTGGERVLRGSIDFIQTNGGIVLPVELSAFDAKARGNDVDVFWATMSESKSDHFIVERASVTEAGTSSYNQVTRVAAAGNSTARRDYSTVDKDLAAGEYLYRLSTVDVDGTVSTSTEVSVIVTDEVAGLTVEPVMPQPASNAGGFTFSLPTTSVVRIEIINTVGERMALLANESFSVGTHDVDVPVSNLANGYYTIVITSDAGQATTPLVVQR
ncbi:MAG: hypothetical protein SGJ05_08300 [bacterium]|nr:hypothetical protein [bacterium]